MGVEILLAYMALMFVGGPAIVVYGLFILVRGRVRLSRGTVLHGDEARIAGLLTAVAGVAFTWFLWSMAGYFPH